jgi:hypothetical protein
MVFSAKEYILYPRFSGLEFSARTKKKGKFFNLRDEEEEDEEDKAAAAAVSDRFIHPTVSPRLACISERGSSES